MKQLGPAAVAVGGLIGLTVGLAPAVLAAPVDIGSAQDAVDRFEGEGYTVIVNKVGSAALSDCSVTAARPGPTYARVDSGVPGAHSGMDNTVGELTFTELSKTIYVDVIC